MYAICPPRYAQMDRVDTDSIRARYSVSNKVDTLLVFQEDTGTPVASVAMTDLPYPTMKDIIEANKFLVLPRLSSQVSPVGGGFGGFKSKFGGGERIIPV